VGILFWLFSFLATSSFAQNIEKSSDLKSQTTISNQKELPAYQDTGNPELDAQNYKKAKEEWITKNPAAYQKMISASSNTKVKNENRSTLIKISSEEYEKLTPEKQIFIKENTHLYTIVEGKNTSVVYVSSSEFETMPLSKQEMIKSNPDLYKIID